MESKSVFQDSMLLLLRLVFGGAMLGAHGLRKVKRILSSEEIKFSDPLGIGSELSLYLAAFSEALCAVLIIIGLFTRLATLPLIVTMGVVVLFVQLNNPFSDMELPLLYLVGFLILLAFGAGRFSFDEYRKKLW